MGRKNGANLYFYWDALSIYNIKYIVKVGQTRDWEQGTEIFRSKVNKYRYIRPNQGDYYYMIKAVDDHGNYSQDATWYLMTADKEINKNVIIDYNQLDVGYSGIKTNMYYNAQMQGLRLEKTSFNGEYLMQINLPQKIKARNWIDCKLNAVTEQTLRVRDMTFAVNSYEAEHVLVCGILGDLDGVELQKQIARYTGKNDDVFNAIIDGTTKPTNGTIIEERNTQFSPVKWGDGVLITDTTSLAYSCDINASFSMGFWFKNNSLLNDCIILELRGSKPNKSDYISVGEMSFTVNSYEAQHLWADGIFRDITLYIGYDARSNQFYLKDSVSKKTLTVSVPKLNHDWLYFGVSQTDTTRLFFIREFNMDTSKYAKAFIPPCSNSFDRLFLNPKE